MTCHPALVRAADQALSEHPCFGDSNRILAKVLARYRFGVELFAEHLPEVAQVAPGVARLDDAGARRLFFDPLLRLALERAFSDLEAGTLTAPHRLEELLPIALQALPLGLCESRMPAPASVGTHLPKWLWDVTQTGDPLILALRAAFDGIFADGTRSGGVLLVPDVRSQQVLDDAIELLATLLPRSGAQALWHVGAIALLSARLEGGTVLSAAGGDLTPSTIFLSVADLGNPWDVAGCLLHEGLHMKLFDAARSVSLAAQPSETISVPWRDVRWSIVRAVFAYHVYVHLALFKAAAVCAEPELLRRFGDPGTMITRPHAMSVVHNDESSRYGRSLDRARYLGEQLRGPWAPLLSSEGRDFVRWLGAALEPLERADRSASSVRAESTYRKAPGLRTWPVEASECMMAFSPSARALTWLDLNACLVFELSDGRTPSELERAYLEIVGSRVTAEEARRQLRSGMDSLVSHALVEYPTHNIGGAS